MTDAATERFHDNVKAISDSIDQRDRLISELSDALQNLLPCAFDGPAYDAAVAVLAKARAEQVSA